MLDPSGPSEGRVVDQLFRGARPCGLAPLVLSQAPFGGVHDPQRNEQWLQWTQSTGGSYMLTRVVLAAPTSWLPNRQPHIGHGSSAVVTLIRRLDSR